jgi:hypothetical protein
MRLRMVRNRRPVKWLSASSRGQDLLVGRRRLRHQDRASVPRTNVAYGFPALRSAGRLPGEALGLLPVEVQRKGWLVLKVGLIARYTTELLISKVESIEVAQSLLGRLFDFGDLTVTGTGVAREVLPARENSDRVPQRRAVGVDSRRLSAGVDPVNRVAF